MNGPWPQVVLKDVLRLDLDRVVVDPVEIYAMVGVYSFGRGLFRKGSIAGSGTSYKFFYRLKADHVVLSQLFGWEGALALSSREFDGLYVSPQFPTFLCDANRLDRRFLGWVFRRPSFWADLGTRTKGMGDRRRTVSPDAFLRSVIPLPPLAEQRRIVARIEALAAKVEAARALREAAGGETDALIGSELHGLFSDLRHRRDCQHARLGDVAKLQRGRFSHRPRNDPVFFGGSHPWIQIGEIESAGKYITGYTETLNDAGLAISRKFPKGTLLISIAATIGAIGILDFDCCIPDSIVAVMPDDSRASSEFIYYYLAFVRGHLEEIAPQSAQKNINLKILDPLPISLPPLSEQRRIVAYLDDLQARVDAVRQHQAATVAALDALLPSILDRAFRGEL